MNKGNKGNTRNSEAFHQKWKEGNGACKEGNHRLAATKYLQAFQAVPDLWHIHRWPVFQCYTFTLIAYSSIVSLEDDMLPLKAIVYDPKELKLYRIQAAFTTGMLLWLRGDRDEAGDYYRNAIGFAEKVPKQQKRHKVAFLTESGPGPGLQPMQEQITDIVRFCSDNLQRMESLESPNAPPPEPRFSSIGTSIIEPIVIRFPVCSFTTGDGRRPFSREQVNNLTRVGGERCDCCGKSRKELGKTLLDVCNGCRKAYYCSRECQVKQWKAGHNLFCRKPGEFKAGDIVRLQNHALHGTLMQVVKEDPNSAGHWQVTTPGETKCMSVSSTQMEQCRPLK